MTLPPFFNAGDIKMLSKEELLQNIDELYDAYLNGETEKKRLKSLNASLRKGFEDYAERCRKEAAKFKEEISEKDKEIATLRANPQQTAITPQQAVTLLLSPLPRELLFIKNAPDIGGVINTFWNRYNNPPNNRYKLFIGYLYECRGWIVHYEDDNKRIICHKGDRLIVIAAEESNIININVLYALASRAMSLKVDYPSFEVSAVCIISGKLSKKTKIVADKFGISAKEDFKFQNFPFVKCKVLPNGQHVHYTPNDKEYFTARIIPQNGDIFCLTENDAVAKGF